MNHEKWQKSLVLLKMWKELLGLYCIITCIQNVEGYFWDLDIGIHAGLQRGNGLSKQTGSYLQDSFRTNVIAPTILQIVDSLKKEHRENVIQDLHIFGLFLTSLVLGSISFYIKRKFSKNVKKNLMQIGNTV